MTLQTGNLIPGVGRLMGVPGSGEGGQGRDGLVCSRTYPEGKD